MSRLMPLSIPANVEVTLKGQHVRVKGSKGNLELEVHASVEVKQEDNVLTFLPGKDDSGASAIAGTTRSLLNNMIHGVENGYEKKLELLGVGFRARIQGKVLNLTLGFSHPVNFDVPEGVSIETPSQTEILVKGINKEKVGQVAANIRAYRPPEPYKGKGIKYSDERIVRKEAKKK